MRILLLDNYDSFTYNLAQQLERAGAQVTVRRNDAIPLDEIVAMDTDGLVVSPGPGHPRNPSDVGVCADAIRKLAPTIPTLGVCLGLQTLAHVHGARIVRAPELLHGKRGRIEHEGVGLLRDLPNPFSAGRYHSLVVDPDTLPPELEVTATGPRGEIMALEHREHPLAGVQFHPESILTDHGDRLIANYLEACA